MLKTFNLLVTQKSLPSSHIRVTIRKQDLLHHIMKQERH